MCNIKPHVTLKKITVEENFVNHFQTHSTELFPNVLQTIMLK